MASARDLFPLLLDALRGRGDLPADAEPAAIREAERFLERGRAVAGERPVPRAWIRRARKLARRTPPRFRLAFDSWLQARPALRRSRSSEEPRYLRYDEPFALELEISAAGRTATLLGQLGPDHAGRDVALHAGSKVRRARVAEDGTFRFAAVPRGVAELECAGVRLSGLTL